MGEGAIPEFSLALFEPLLGQVFRIGDGPQAVDARLVEANNLREAQGAGRLSRQFSLLWLGPREANLAQGIYRVVHPSLPPLELFLVCLGPVAEGMRYEAVFT